MRRALPPAVLSAILSALLAALAPACAPDGRGSGPAIELASEARSVELGLPFMLVLTQSYGREFAPVPFDPRSLAPLEVRVLSSSRRSRGGRVTQTLRLQAQVFELGAVVVPAPILRVRPRAGGAERSAVGEALELEVRSALAAAPQGAAARLDVPELPELLRSEPSPWPLALLGAALLLVAGGALGWRGVHARRRAARRAGSARPAADPRARALARLGDLGRRTAAAAGPDAAFHAELADSLRDFLDEALGLPAPRRSREELLADPRTARALDAGARAVLEGILSACDRVKFARASAGPGERAGLLAAAEAWLGAAPDAVDPSRSGAEAA